MTSTPRNLTWDSLGTDNPGDQGADSALGGYYGIGPDGPTNWSVTLVLFGDAAHDVTESDLGRFESEDAAKAAAQAYETEHVPVSPSGLTADDDCDDPCAVHAFGCDGFCDHGLGGVPHHNACLPDMSAPSGNDNCLDGLRCPRCGNEASFRIAATATFLVVDDGTEEHENVEWDDASRIDCTGCYHSATVADFTVTAGTA